YDRGWRGINIEPTDEYFKVLSAARNRDVNLQVAVGRSPGECSFFVIPGTGLSTLNPDIAAQHTKAGWPVHETRRPVMTLAEICRKHAPPDIHFLKIDVECAERDVLSGADFTAYRPWIVVVEATRPNSPEPHYEHWEPLLLEARYNFVWFDGLNRF